MFANPLAVVSGNGADLTLAAPLTSRGRARRRCLSAGRNFLNTAGAAAIDPGAGVWPVYSTDQAADMRGGLAADFKQYGAIYGVTPVLGSGDGFLYRVAPVLTPTLAGTVDRSTTATPRQLAPASVGTSGAIDGDSASRLSAPRPSTRATPAAPRASRTGDADGREQRGDPGLRLHALGRQRARDRQHQPGALALAADGDSKVYDGGDASAVARRGSGAVGGDTVSALAQVFDSRNAGSRTLSSAATPSTTATAAPTTRVGDDAARARSRRRR